MDVTDSPADNCQLERVEQTELLEVIITEKLTWDELTSLIFSKVNEQIGILKPNTCLTDSTQLNSTQLELS